MTDEKEGKEAESGTKEDDTQDESQTSDAGINDAGESEDIGETWVDYIRRATVFADLSMEKAKCRDWVVEQRRRKC